jgi:hypothetical protein
MANWNRLSGLVVFIGMTGAAPAYADAVTHWNNIAVPAVAAGRPGLGNILDLALVQAAVHDAVQAIEAKYEPYYAVIPGASGSQAAAVAAAARGVLVGLYPAQQPTLDAAYNAYLTANGLAGDPGLAVGHHAAAMMLTQYRPTPTLPPYVGGNEPGQWRPTPSYIGSPPNPAPFSPMAFLFLAVTTPCTLNRPSQFRPEPPPPLTSEHYRRDYDEVMALGARSDSARTPAQTDAYFWSDNFIALWNRTLRTIVDTHPMSLGESARLFTLANLSVADAAISCWESKYHFSFWRPVTAIQEAISTATPTR